MKNDIIKIKAKLFLYPTEKGGRKTGVATGYRPNHVFEYKDNDPSQFVTTYIGQVYFEKDLISLGKIEIVKVIFLNHQNISDLLKVGRIWWIHEGQRKIGEAEVLEILTYGES